MRQKEHLQREKLTIKRGIYFTKATAHEEQTTTGIEQRVDDARQDAHLKVVAGLLDQLGRHPEGRTDKSDALLHRLGQLSGHTEVGHLDIAVLRHKNVRGCKERTEGQTHCDIQRKREETERGREREREREKRERNDDDNFKRALIAVTLYTWHILLTVDQRTQTQYYKGA